MLACSSTDGTVSFLLFTEDDLGKRQSEEQVQKALRKLYGDVAMNSNMVCLPRFTFCAFELLNSLF